MVISTAPCVLGFQNSTLSNLSPPQHQPCRSGLLPAPHAHVLSPSFAFGAATAHTHMSSCSCLFNAAQPSTLSEFQLPRETSSAHVRLSILQIPVSLLQLPAPSFVLNASPVILCRSVVSPQRVPHIWFIIYQPGSAPLWVLEGCSDS